MDRDGGEVEPVAFHGDGVVVVRQDKAESGFSESEIEPTCAGEEADRCRSEGLAVHATFRAPAAAITSSTALSAVAATGGGTAFPIWRTRSRRLPRNTNPSGNPCSAASSAVRSRRDSQ